MRSFSTTDLGNKTGDVLAAASQGPTAISKHGKSRFVILTSETFNKLKRGSDPRVSTQCGECRLGAHFTVFLHRSQSPVSRNKENGPRHERPFAAVREGSRMLRPQAALRTFVQRVAFRKFAPFSCGGACCTLSHQLRRQNCENC